MQGKLAVVTGASSGIGRATAELLAARGAFVLLLARKGARLEEVADGIKRRGGEAAAFPVDLADAAATERVAAKILARHGVPDIIFNNAGSGRWLSLIETSPDEARQMIELPYLAAFYVTRFFLPAMIERGSGQIACITSPASQLVWSNACGYIAARHALYGFTEALRAEMKGKGIDVTLVTLGVVSSDYWEHNPGARDRVPRVPSWLAPELSVEQAAETVVAALEERKAHVYRPWLARLLIALGLNLRSSG